MMNSLRKALIESGAIRPLNKARALKMKPMKLRPTKRKNNLVPFREVKEGFVFQRKNRTYLKVCEAFSVEEETGKDAIFLHHELVEPLYPVI